MGPSRKEHRAEFFRLYSFLKLTEAMGRQKEVYLKNIGYYRGSAQIKSPKVVNTVR
jgi:hypothetical protein